MKRLCSWTVIPSHLHLEQNDQRRSTIANTHIYMYNSESHIHPNNHIYKQYNDNVLQPKKKKQIGIDAQRHRYHTEYIYEITIVISSRHEWENCEPKHSFVRSASLALWRLLFPPFRFHFRAFANGRMYTQGQHLYTSPTHTRTSQAHTYGGANHTEWEGINILERCALCVCLWERWVFHQETTTSTFSCSTALVRFCWAESAQWPARANIKIYCDWVPSVFLFPIVGITQKKQYILIIVFQPSQQTPSKWNFTNLYKIIYSPIVRTFIQNLKCEKKLLLIYIIYICAEK